MSTTITQTQSGASQAFITQTVLGVKGDAGQDGENVDQLEPRLEAAELAIQQVDVENGIKTNDW